MIITTEQLHEVLNKLRTIDRKIIKSNLRIECSKLYKTYGGRNKVIKLTGLTSAVFTSMINTGSPANITLENLITLLSTLNININEILTEHNSTDIVQWSNDKKIWTDEVKKEFVIYCEQNSIHKASQHYNIRKLTAKAYYKNFKEEFKI